VDDEAMADAMRERGLGTPATRASIIEVLIKREYVRREKKALVPTEKGETLVGLAPAELCGVETTGEWEARLRQIEDGAGSAEDFLHGIGDLTRRIVQDVRGQERAAPAAATGKEAIGKCPACGGQIVEGRKGYGCARWHEQDGGCRWVIWKEVAGKALSAAVARELLTAGETKREIRGFQSKAGKEFSARLRLDRETGRVTFVFEPRPAAAIGNSGATAAQRPAARSAGRTGTKPPTRSAAARR
jgi:DNA topoisomerase-3